MKALTKAEKVAILEETFKLIQEPANWITGDWKCPLYQTDEKGQLVRDTEGHPIPAYDRFNRPQAQYCIEGAANQATINVLGEERARRMGVEETGDWMAEKLGLNELARELHPDYECAMDLNDSFGHGKLQRQKGHTTILGLVRTRLDRLMGRDRVPA